jgi:hypothetical protein
LAVSAVLPWNFSATLQALSVRTTDSVKQHAQFGGGHVPFVSEDRTSCVRSSALNTVSDIAAYLMRNPPFEVGIDGSIDTRRSNQQDRDLSNHRADSVRDALMQAGVPADKIQMGAFADPTRQHEGQILVLIKTRAGRA